MNEEVARLKEQLEQAEQRLLKQEKEIARDNDIPSLEPDLGLTARQEFRLNRLIDMSEDAPIRKHAEALENTGKIDSVDVSKQTVLSRRELHRELRRNLRQAKREAFVRELGSERAEQLARDALERRNIFAAAAKTEKERKTLRSIFNRKHRLSALLIDAFAENHH